MGGSAHDGAEPALEPPFGAEVDGAVVDGRTIAHFGDPTREQRALATGRAVVPRGDRAVIALRGEDRLSWLDSITSQRVAGLLPGESTELLVLSPQGRVEHDAGVFEDGETTWLIADAEDAPGLARWLTMMRFRARVEIAERADLIVVGFVPGASAEQAVAGVAQGRVWVDPWSAVGVGGWQYAQVAEHPGALRLWREAIVDPQDAGRLLSSIEPAGVLAAEALRIAAWRPRWAREVDDRSIPHETDWIRSAVHLDKGCYRGQETVAKVHNLGHPPRRLAALHLDGSDAVLPEPGSAVFAGDDEVGYVTSSARHFEEGPIALAMLSRRAPVGDLVVRADGVDIAAAQQVIVPADAGATAEVPRLTRLSRRPSAPDPRGA